MIKTEFGIMDHIEKDREYIEYEPEKYSCIAIDDDRFIDDWWEELQKMPSYFHSVSRPEHGLSRAGIILIPPQSLPLFYAIVTTDSRFETEDTLKELAGKIAMAIKEEKFMIHFGI